MALQEIEQMSSDIVPQKTLNNIDSMYYYLTQRLHTAQQITDLIPFFKKLMNINELKQHLQSALDKQYKFAKSSSIEENSQKSSSEFEIRSLFISLFSLNGIPSDSIHAHILSFLPSIEYKKLPLLSSHFRNILKNNAYLYNNKGYGVRLEFKVEPERLNIDTKTGINIEHGTHYDRSIGFYSMNPKYPSYLTSDDVDNITIPILQLKKWEIKEEYTWRTVQNLQSTETLDHFEDGHNKYLLNLINTNANKIKKLLVELKESDIIQTLFNANNQFNQCKVLSLRSTQNITLHENSFNNLQCLEISTSPYSFNASKMTTKDINSIMNLTKNTLKCIQIHDDTPESALSLDSIPALIDDQNTTTLKIPKGVEWCSINITKEIKVDLSESDGLIGVQLIGINSSSLEWPSKYTIPFVCIGDTGSDTMDENESETWIHKIKTQQLDAVKLVCLMDKTEAEMEDNDMMFLGSQHGRFTWKYHEEKEIKRVSVHNAFSRSDKCLLLNEDECDTLLLEKLLSCVVKDVNKMVSIIKRFRRWWYLGSAIWMQNITDLGPISNKMPYI